MTNNENNVWCLSFLPGFWGVNYLPQGDTGQNVRSCWLDPDTLGAAGSISCTALC